MKEKQWVQHISGQGEKWEVLNDYPTEFIVRAQKSTTYRHSFPKSEYRPCDPPEEWEDVTEQVVFTSDVPNGLGRLSIDGIALDKSEHRLRKVRLYELIEHQNQQYTRWAFIVERRKSC